VMKESAAHCNAVLLFLCSCCDEGICCSLQCCSTFLV
jgi:hypothetical protein